MLTFKGIVEWRLGPFIPRSEMYMTFLRFLYVVIKQEKRKLHELNWNYFIDKISKGLGTYLKT